MLKIQNDSLNYVFLLDNMDEFSTQWELCLQKCCKQRCDPQEIVFKFQLKFVSSCYDIQQIYTMYFLSLEKSFLLSSLDKPAFHKVLDLVMCLLVMFYGKLGLHFKITEKNDKENYLNGVILKTQIFKSLTILPSLPIPPPFYKKGAIIFPRTGGLTSHGSSIPISRHVFPKVLHYKSLNKGLS